MRGRRAERRLPLRRRSCDAPTGRSPSTTARRTRSSAWRTRTCPRSSSRSAPARSPRGPRAVHAQDGGRRVGPPPAGRAGQARFRSRRYRGQFRPARADTCGIVRRRRRDECAAVERPDARARYRGMGRPDGMPDVVRWVDEVAALRHAGRRPLVRRLGRGIRRPVRPARRGGHVHAAGPGEAAGQLPRARTRAMSPASRTGRSSARARRSTRAPRTTGATPTRCAWCSRTSSAGPCAAGPCT